MKKVTAGATTYTLRGPGGELLTEITAASGSTTVRDYIYAGARLIATATRSETGAPPSVATPTIAPNGGSFPTPQTVTLSTTTSGAAIRYTTDGSTPTETSALYGSPFNVGSTATVKARGFKSGLAPSGVASASFTIGGGGASAQFVTVDTTTHGNWVGTYGQDGALVIEDGQSLPAYAQVTPSGHSTWTWEASTSDLRALQRVTNPATRIAATWFTSTTMRLDVALTDGAPHDVAIYAVDWEDDDRAQRFDIRDAGTGALLDSRTLSGFVDGHYIVWRLTGHVWIDITNVTPENLVISGVFFDPPGGGGGSGPTIAVSPATVAPGGSVTATWSGIATPSMYDWIGLYEPGTPDTSVLEWIYVSCSTTPDSPHASGSCPFTVPGWVTPGAYELRLLENDWYDALATSNPFTVQ